MATEDLPLPAVPHDIGLVRDFVNTTDLETSTDDLSKPAELTAYLRRAGLLTRRTPATDDDLALARLLRGGLRRALELNHDGDTAKIPDLDAALAELPLELQWSASGAALTPARKGIRGALSEIAIAMHNAAAAGIWWRLKICSSDECAWAYYDNSKNQSRNWCEYGCGNRIKTRAYRARQKASARA